MKSIGVNNPVRAVIAASILLLAAAGIAWWVANMGKAIYADYKIGQAYHAIDADIKGECKIRKAIFTDCKATIRHDGHSVEKTFAFFDFTSGDYTVTAIAANDNPANITLDIAVDKIMNRAFSPHVPRSRSALSVARLLRPAHYPCRAAARSLPD